MSSKVKQFVLWLLVLLAWAVPAGALETNLMTHVDGEYLYVIKFVYSTNTYTIPATYPPGPPHYDAEITVTEVRSNAMVEVCPPWRGYYTARKCYEDEPAAVVRQALARRWRRRMAHTDAATALVDAVTRLVRPQVGDIQTNNGGGRLSYADSSWHRSCDDELRNKILLLTLDKQDIEDMDRLFKALTEE